MLTKIKQDNNLSMLMNDEGGYSLGQRVPKDVTPTVVKPPKDVGLLPRRVFMMMMVMGLIHPWHARQSNLPRAQLQVKDDDVKENENDAFTSTIADVYVYINMYYDLHVILCGHASYLLSVQLTQQSMLQVRVSNPYRRGLHGAGMGMREDERIHGLLDPDVLILLQIHACNQLFL